MGVEFGINQHFVMILKETDAFRREIEGKTLTEQGAMEYQKINAMRTGAFVELLKANMPYQIIDNRIIRLVIDDKNYDISCSFLKGFLGEENYGAIIRDEKMPVPQKTYHSGKTLEELSGEDYNVHDKTLRRQETIGEAVWRLEQEAKQARIWESMNPVTVDEQESTEELHKAISKYTNNIKRSSMTDSLTKVYNRKYAEESIRELLKKTEKGTLLILDLDNFKTVNDTYGHATGDNVLAALGNVLHNNITSDNVCGRIGGDEFIIFYNNLEDIEVLSKKAESILTGMVNELSKIDTEIAKVVTASIGFANVTECGNDFSELYQCADKALYKIKKNGKNSYSFYHKEDAFAGSAVEEISSKISEENQDEMLKKQQEEYEKLLKRLEEEKSINAQLSEQLNNALKSQEKTEEEDKTAVSDMQETQEVIEDIQAEETVMPKINVSEKTKSVTETVSRESCITPKHSDMEDKEDLSEMTILDEEPEIHDIEDDNVFVSSEIPDGLDIPEEPEMEVIKETANKPEEILSETEIAEEEDNGLHVLYKNDFMFTYHVVSVYDTNDMEESIEDFEVMIMPLDMNPNPQLLIWVLYDEKSTVVMSTENKTARFRTDEGYITFSGIIENGEFQSNIQPEKDMTQKQGYTITYTTKNFGNKGHVVQKDEGIEIHFMPTSFKNNETGYADFAYCIKQNNNIILGDTSENNEVFFKFNDMDMVMFAQWDENDYFLSSVEPA